MSRFDGQNITMDKSNFEQNDTGTGTGTGTGTKKQQPAIESNKK